MALEIQIEFMLFSLCLTIFLFVCVETNGKQAANEVRTHPHASIRSLGPKCSNHILFNAE